MADQHLGYALIDGVRFDITRIVLSGGQTNFQAEVEGPQSAGKGPIVLFGVDDSGIGYISKDLAWPDIEAQQRLVVSFGIVVYGEIKDR